MPSLFSSLQYRECAGSGKLYSAPGPGPVVAVSYNGILLRRGIGLLGYNETAGIINLNFSTEDGDRIYALCVA